MDASVKKGAGSQHHAAGSEPHAHLRRGTDDALAFEQQVIASALEQPEQGLVLQPLPDRSPVQHPIGLGARCTHGRPLRAIQNAELNAGFVGGQGHRATQGVDLLDQMSLADPANRRVAAHLSQGFDVVGQQQRPGTHARAGQRGLGASMPPTNHDDVKLTREPHDPRTPDSKLDCRERRRFSLAGRRSAAVLIRAALRRAPATASRCVESRLRGKVGRKQ